MLGLSYLLLYRYAPSLLFHYRQSSRLKLAQNDLDRLGAVFEASGLLADVLARYANIEANYRDRDFGDSEQLERTIIDVYVAVLEYSAEVTVQSQKNIPRKC